jgi:hypothetical protein
MIGMRRENYGNDTKYQYNVIQPNGRIAKNEGEG